MADSEVNKRTVENFIKSGTFDGLGGTRKQFMSVFAQMMDSQQHNKKNNLAGQISLFDLVSEEEKSDFEIRLPDVGEYSKELLLGFEKEVLGIYISGHPLEEYEQTWRKHITRTTADFMIDLLHISGGSLATLLSSGTFMLTWQFETNSSFNPSSSVTMDFSDSLLSLAGDYGMSALAVRDGMPSLAVPEPATASLSLFGLAALLMRRRRSR